MSAQTKTKRQWTSRFAFLMASIGAAVGLGNLWRFPFQAGENGGSAFVLVYLLCIALLAFPVLTAELAIGRRGGLSAVGSTARLARDAGRPVSSNGKSASSHEHFESGTACSACARSGWRDRCGSRLKRQSAEGDLFHARRTHLRRMRSRPLRPFAKTRIHPLLTRTSLPHLSARRRSRPRATRQ